MNHELKSQLTQDVVVDRVRVRNADLDRVGRVADVGDVARNGTVGKNDVTVVLERRLEREPAQVLLVNERHVAPLDGERGAVVVKVDHCAVVSKFKITR